MLFNRLKHIVSRHRLNIGGKSIRQKLVVFESDDWGSIRMSSKQDYEFLKKRYPIDQCYFSTNDMIESNDDLQFLAETLLSIKGSDGLPAKFTLNNIVGNPDFEKIKASGFTEYHHEPFIKTLERYPNHNNVIKYYKDGLRNNIFQLQFHGREHVHVEHWMDALQRDDKTLQEIFDRGMFSIFQSHETSTCNGEFQNAMATYTDKQYEFVKNSITEGTAMFEQLWGFRSASVIAPCYTWQPRVEEVFKNCGIDLIQGGKVQVCPSDVDGVDYSIRHNFGQTNEHGQTYLVRNVHFEPTTIPSVDWVDKALTEIEIAFLWNKPALISTHRLNYIGGLVPGNRERNLRLLKELLMKIMKRWPDVMFVSTDELKKYLE